MAPQQQRSAAQQVEITKTRAIAEKSGSNNVIMIQFISSIITLVFEALDYCATPPCSYEPFVGFCTHSQTELNALTPEENSEKLGKIR